jgi:hypothetical protein
MNPVWWKVRRPSGTTNSAIYFDPYLIPKVFIYLIFKGILDSASGSDPGRAPSRFECTNGERLARQVFPFYLTLNSIFIINISCLM